MKLSTHVLCGILLLGCPAFAETRATTSAPAAAPKAAGERASKEAKPAEARRVKREGEVAAQSKAKPDKRAASTGALPALDAKILRKQAELSRRLDAARRDKVVVLGRELAAEFTKITADTETKPLDSRAREGVIAAGLGTHDIETLTFLVMAEAAKDAREDLKAIMAQVKAINYAKQQCKTLACLAALKPNKDVDQPTLDVVRDRVKDKLDSLSEMGEMESLRLQMAMERMSKVSSMLSNLQKKLSDTQQGIIQSEK